MEKARFYGIVYLSCALVLFVGSICVYGMDKDSANGAIEISAVSLSYFPSEAKIIGEGEVIVRQGDFKLRADKVIFFIIKKEIFAKAFLGSRVKVVKGKHVLYGSEAYYNALKKEGYVVNAEGEVRGVRFYGEKVEFGLTDKVPASRFFLFKTKPIKLKKPGFEVVILHGKFTSCKLYNPTYFVSGKRITVYPNGNVRIVKPSLFIGGHKVVSFPFDYSFNLKKGRGLMMVPMVGYTSNLGWYGGGI